MKTEIKSSIKNFLKTKIVGTQCEWESHIENIFRLCERNLSNRNFANLLDVCCSMGQRTIRTAEYLGINLENTYGVDYDDGLIAEASKNIMATTTDLEIENLPYDDNTFELVICNQVLEHLKHYDKVINDIIRVTQNDGIIILGIPNLAHLINRLYLLFGVQPMCIQLDGFHVRGFAHKSFVTFLNGLAKVHLGAPCRLLRISDVSPTILPNKKNR
jgi:2-polyprenyl-3-methyl-5-hydroxy-6-metoxy-1,4-benzoquinol methylase